jgi:hypothetical protein
MFSAFLGLIGLAGTAAAWITLMLAIFLRFMSSEMRASSSFSR